MNVESPQYTNHTVAPADEADLRSQVLNNLFNLSTYLVAVQDLPVLQRGLAEQVVAVVPSIQASILWLYDRQQAALYVAASFGLDPSTYDEVLAQLRLRSGEGLVGEALKRGEPLLVEGRRLYRDMASSNGPRNLALLRQLADRLPRDLTAVFLPLRMGSEVIGVLELLNLGHSPSLRGQDLQVLQTFANLAAGAIKNAQLHAQTQAHQRRLEAFDAIGTAVSAASDLDELMGDVLDVVLGVVRVEAGALLLLDPARGVLVIGAQRNLPRESALRFSEFAVAGSACEEAVRYGQPIRRPLLPEGQEEALIAAGLHSCVYLPLLAGGTVVGVMGMYGDELLHQRVDVQALMMMGNLVGFAIANVMLYRDSQIERRKLAAVINSIAEGVMLCDGQGRVVLANETARELLAIERIPYEQPLDEMVGYYHFRDLDDRPLPLRRLPLARALAGEVFHDYRVLLRGASGNDTVMSFSGAPVSNDNPLDDPGAPAGAVVVFRDVTASQKIERAKDDFLAVAAHELRSPLAAVRSYTDLLVRREQRRDEDSPELRGLTILAQQVTHMLGLVDNLLDVSRLDADQLSLQLQPVNLVSLAEQVLQQHRPAAGERELLLESTRHELMVVCDQLRIRQVLTNLVSNAIRYSAAGTPVCLSLDTLRADELAARHPEFVSLWNGDSTRSGDQLVALVVVEDRGAGISEEQRGRLFKRYARGLDRRGEGLGLGLYLSREFVIRHGGAIWVESVPEQGSTFYVALPLLDDRAADQQVQEI